MDDPDIEWGDLFVLVYSVTDRSSFEQLSALKHQILRLRADDDSSALRFVIAGNKSDLEASRQVQTAEGEAAAHRMGALFFCETSAKANINVSMVFGGFARRIYDTQPESSHDCVML